MSSPSREDQRSGNDENMDDISSLSIVIPVYNSEATIGRLVDAVVETLARHFTRLEIVLVNDGSIDQSHRHARDAQRRHTGIVRYIQLARNFGEHNAVMCGLRYVTGDCAVIIDDDFQNPPAEILKLVNKLREGYDVVYSYYEQKRHYLFRNLGSRFNDRVATKLLRKPKGLYLSSFKAINRFLVRSILEYTGPYPYIDGLILRSTTSIGRQLCEHHEREAGRSNYTLQRLIRLWLNMFTSFSVVPLRLASIMGFAMSFLGLGLAVLFVLSWLKGGIFFQQTIPPGWGSLIVCVTVFAGIQLMVLGMIGEYLGRLTLTQNRSPQYIVRQTYGVEPARNKNDQR